MNSNKNDTDWFTKFGWIITSTIFSIFIAYITMPSMAMSIRRDLFFYGRAYQVGLVVTVVVSAVLFCLQRYRIKTTFFVELIIAFSIVASYYAIYREMQRDMQIQIQHWKLLQDQLEQSLQESPK